MAQYTPKVKEAHAFLEISQDFTTPAEIFRESIANSLDAYARRMWPRAVVENVRGRETVFIDLSDARSEKDFNHSFENLEAIVCWNARLKDGNYQGW